VFATLKVVNTFYINRMAFTSKAIFLFLMKTDLESGVNYSNGKY